MNSFGQIMIKVSEKNGGVFDMAGNQLPATSVKLEFSPRKIEAVISFATAETIIEETFVPKSKLTDLITVAKKVTILATHPADRSDMEQLRQAIIAAEEVMVKS